ncbi:MAG: MerR family transcriptional regulator [Deltaproteobacteria bacterium]|nr:MAG: MerR family transcriptional regulator [Deltaproteobacteria bacterium]
MPGRALATQAQDCACRRTVKANCAPGPTPNGPCARHGRTRRITGSPLGGPGALTKRTALTYVKGGTFYMIQRRARPSSRPAPAEKPGLTISTLAKRAGVSRATVTHYVALGLLPKPTKTARNMAYYDPECVERIELIRELQRKRRLPLTDVKRLLDEHGDGALHAIVAETKQMERFVEGWLSAKSRTVSRDELIKASGLSREDLDELERMGLLERSADGRYDSVSEDLAVAVGRMQREGLSAELGFDVADVDMYRRTIERFVGREIELFNRRVLGRVPASKSRALVLAALEGAEKVWVAVRRRVLLRFVEQLDKGPPRSRPAKKRR